MSFQSRAVGVGSDEDTGATVGSSGIGSSYNEPSRVIPERGKVPKDIGKSQREVSGDVLQDDESRSQRANGGGNVGPEVSLIGLSLPLSCVGERLAGVAAGEDVHGLDLRPVDDGDVAEVRHAGVVRGEDRAGGGLDLGVPREARRKHLRETHSETLVTAEQTPDGVGHGQLRSCSRCQSDRRSASVSDALVPQVLHTRTCRAIE
jgi:hypothetical protein